MLDFFRRYQRYFFIVIAAFIVVSFSFFGIHQTVSQPKQEKDQCLGQAIDGSKMMQSEVDQMIHFIWSDRNDLALTEKGIMPNFFNDGVIRQDLMEKGIGALLVNAYFNDLKEELQERMFCHKNYRPYVHPTAPFISMKNLWGQVFPAQKQNLERFLGEAHEMTPETFSLLVDLYLGEAACPPHILREYLIFQEKHYDWIQPDPVLPRTNLNLFRCYSAEDWFGSRFFNLSAQFILNAAAYAKKQGYKVSYEQAHVDLIRKGYESLQIQKRKENVKQEEVANLWKEQLHSLGMSEKEAVRVWQKVMLFRCLFNDVGRSVFIDPHMYQKFYGFAAKTADVDVYHLPDALEFKSFLDLMKFEYYLDQVLENRDQQFVPPQVQSQDVEADKGQNQSLSLFGCISEIEKKCPALIEERFLVEVAEVQRSEVALNVTIKEMWEWQLEKTNYELLEKQFPGLALKKGGDAEQYFSSLEKIDPELRQKIDKFSRERIVETHPEWIEDALNQKHSIVKQISLSPGDDRFPYEGKDLPGLFRTAALKGELTQDQAAIKNREALELYTTDQETYYRFYVLDRDLTKTVLTFEEANQKGILDSLLDKYLEKLYCQIRVKDPAMFKTAEHEWKPFKEVKEAIGSILYLNVLNTIDAEVSKLGVDLPEERRANLDSFYPKYRFFPYMIIAKQKIRELGDKSPFLGKGNKEEVVGKLPEKGGLSLQWNLIKEEKLIKSYEKSPWFTSDMFAMVEKSWSEVFFNEEERLQFLQLKEKSVPSGCFLKEIRQGQEILSKEIKQSFMHEFLENLKAKKAINLRYDTPERT